MLNDVLSLQMHASKTVLTRIFKRATARNAIERATLNRIILRKLRGESFAGWDDIVRLEDSYGRAP